MMSVRSSDPTRPSTPTRAVILARGLGSRMRERDEDARVGAAQADAADRGIKAMIPIDRPFLDYVLSALADAGWTEICLVIGPEHDVVRDYYTRVAPPRRTAIAFAIQAEPRGTADALLAAEPFARAGAADAEPGARPAASTREAHAAADVLVLNGDNYYPADELRRLRALDGPGTVLFEPDALVRASNVPPERIRAFAIGTVTPDGHLARLIEKPDEAAVRALGAGALVSMNCWRVPLAIFDVCRRVQPSARGELELPHAIRDAVERDGMRLRVLRGRSGILDLSRRGDIAAVAERLRLIVPEP